MAKSFKPCVVADCNGDANKSGALGFCRKHYYRFNKYGDPQAGGPMRMMGIESCTHEGCIRAATRRGLCSKHRSRLASNGTTNKIGVPLLESWTFIHSDYELDECLEFPFNKGMNGRGVITIDGNRTNAARAMCIVAHGPPPTSKHQSAHSCGRGHEGCVNPRHLSWKTAKENNADKELHGTLLRGEVAPQSKLCERQVREIRSRKKNCNDLDLAIEYGVSRRAISKIKSGDTWGWLDGYSEAIKS